MYKLNTDQAKISINLYKICKTVTFSLSSSISIYWSINLSICLSPYLLLFEEWEQGKGLDVRVGLKTKRAKIHNVLTIRSSTRKVLVVFVPFE